MTTDAPYLAGRIRLHATASPERHAAVCDGHPLDYRNLVRRANACAARLLSLGLHAGGEEKVAILASPSLDYIVVAVACQFAGIAFVPLPDLLAADAHGRLLDDSGSTVVFYDEAHAESLQAAVALPGDRQRRLQCIRITSDPGAASPSPLDVWAGTPSSSYRSPALQGGWLSDLIYSSGTTGTPKGIAQTYAARAETNVSLAPLGVSAGTNLLQTIGLYSNFSLTSLWLSLWWGGTFFAMRKFSGAAVVDLLARERIDMAWLPPATLVRTLQAPGFEAAVRGKSCVKLCAGAPLSEAHKLRVLADWPGPFFEIYGQTETGTLTLLPIHAVPRDKISSVGRPLPSVSLLIMGDDDRILPPGTEGEIVARSSTLMAGYHRRDDANAAVLWHDASGLSYIRTGDIGKLDEDGYLWLCDRKKDMIISGGYNVYPADIERALVEHPAVLETAVVGFPSARWGESPVAFVTLRTGAAATADELREWLNRRVGAVQRLAQVRILEALPSGSMGKVLKRELRNQFAEQIGTLP